MCGRVSIFYTWSEIFEAMSLTAPAGLPDFEARFNISPTSTVWILRPDENGDLRPDQARWGLIPHWWRHGQPMRSTHNARTENLSSGMWRESYAKRRCILPISGFFEWTMMPERRPTDLLGAPIGKEKMVKRPFYISRQDGRPILLAAIWDVGPDPKTGEPRLSVANITCKPDDWMAQYHDRAPVILEPEDVGRWIETGDQDLLRMPDRNQLQAWPVRQEVGNTAYQAPDAVESIEI